MFNAMEMGHDSEGYKQSSKEEQWQQRLARFAASGQPVKQFCHVQRRGVGHSAFKWVSEFHSGYPLPNYG